MTTRHLLAAALMACAFAAHADVINASTATGTSGFLSGWTTGNGTDVIASGVLAGNVNLVGGIAYGSGSGSAGAQGSNLTDVLLGKASGSLGSAAGSTELYYTNGIDGTYLLGKGHGILAAMLGNGVALVASNGGVLVNPESNGSLTPVGGTGGGTGSKGDTGGTGGGGSSPGSGADGGTGASTGGSGGTLDLSAGGGTGTNPGNGLDGTGGGTSPGDEALPPPKVVPAATAAVPEPSTIALMLAGVLGAGAVRRRRTR